MFTLHQWYTFFLAWGAEPQDAQASAHRAYEEQWGQDASAGPPLTAQPRLGIDPWINGQRPLWHFA